MRLQHDPHTNEFVGASADGPLAEVFEDVKFGNGGTDDICNMNIYSILFHEGLREMISNVCEREGLLELRMTFIRSSLSSSMSTFLSLNLIALSLQLLDWFRLSVSRSLLTLLVV